MARDASGRVEEILRRLHSQPWEDKSYKASSITFSDILGRRVRSDNTWQGQQVSTIDRIRQALEQADFREAAALGDFFEDEAAIIYDLYRNWINDLNEYLLQRGTPEPDLEELNRHILSLLTLPDGRPFQARRLWEEFRSAVREFTVLCGEQRVEEALKLAEAYKELWRQLHDRDVDHIYGLINDVVVRYGETSLEDMWDKVLAGLFTMRYEKFDITKFPWDESLKTNVYLAFEAMRSHLVGPGRRGNVEFQEDQDRYTFRFDPCGSGGHIVRGDEVEGSPPRMEPPFGWGVTTQKHDFAWNKEGVCYYCTECCLVMQRWPIDAFGYPVRVVEPPTYPRESKAKCTWHVYKDPAQVPERFYTEVGRKKPKAFGPQRNQTG